jgi:hypothetical protein
VYPAWHILHDSGELIPPACLTCPTKAHKNMLLLVAPDIICWAQVSSVNLYTLVCHQRDISAFFSCIMTCGLILCGVLAGLPLMVGDYYNSVGPDCW